MVHFGCNISTAIALNHCAWWHRCVFNDVYVSGNEYETNLSWWVLHFKWWLNWNEGALCIFDGSKWKRVNERIRENERVVNTSWKSYKDRLERRKRWPMWRELQFYAQINILSKYTWRKTANSSKRLTFFFCNFHGVGSFFTQFLSIYIRKISSAQHDLFLEHATQVLFKHFDPNEICSLKWLNVRVFLSENNSNIVWQHDK